MSADRGKETEELFLKAWANAKHYPSWMESVRGATKIEDHREKTDAVIIKKDGSVLRIQIKMGRVGKDRRKNYAKNDIIILQIRPDWNEQRVRRKTLAAINRFYSHKEQRAYWELKNKPT